MTMMSCSMTKRLMRGVITFLFACAPASLWAQCMGPARDKPHGSNLTSIAITAAQAASDCPRRTGIRNAPLLKALPHTSAFAPPDFPTINHAPAGGPSGTEKIRSRRSDWGRSTLSLSGYRFKSTPTRARASDLIAEDDRSALWGGRLNYDVAVGGRDAVGFGFGGNMGKQRSAFTPQVVHRYSSQSWDAMIRWRHDRSVSLAIAMRGSHISAVTAPLERQAARAAGSPLEAVGVHLAASLFPFGNQKDGERPDRFSLTLDAYRQRLSAREASVFSATGNRRDSGASLTVRLRF